MSRRRSVPLGAGALALGLIAATAPAGETLQAPDGYDVPLSTFTVERQIVYPLSTFTILREDVGSSTVEQLLEEFDAEDGADGTVLRVPDRVLFDFGSADLRDTAADRIDRLVALLERATDGQIRVQGHTDDIGTDQANQQLSEDRAQAVADALEAAGIDADRLTTEGFGSSQPVAPNRDDDGADDPDGRQQNRRVEIVVDLS